MFDVNEFMPSYEEENQNNLEISETALSDEVLTLSAGLISRQ